MEKISGLKNISKKFDRQQIDKIRKNIEKKYE